MAKIKKLTLALGAALGASLIVAAPSSAAPASELTIGINHDAVPAGGAVVISGRLADKATGAGLADQSVKVGWCVFKYSPKRDFCFDETVKTDADGKYEAKPTQTTYYSFNELGFIKAEYAGTEAYEKSAAEQRYDTGMRIRYGDVTANPNPVVKGDTVKISGYVGMYTGGPKDVPWQGLTLKLFSTSKVGKYGPEFDWRQKPQETKVGADGTFSFEDKPDQATFYRVANETYNYNAFNIVREVQVKVADKPSEPKPVTYSAEIADLDKPGQVAQGTHGQIKLKSHLVSSKGDRTANKGAHVQLQFSPKNSGGQWHDNAQAWVGNDGRAAFNVTFKEDGFWRVVLSATGKTQRVEKSFFVDTKYGTKATVDAGPEPVKKGRSITVKGKLTNKDGGPVDRAKVAVFFKAKGTGVWKFAGWAWTNGSGDFAKKFKAKQDGSWRFKYDGDAENFRTTSNWDYVDVR